MPRRPPKKWFYAMVERLKKEYPNYPPARIEKIAAGVWYKKYGPETKAKVVSAEHHSPTTIKIEIPKWKSKEGIDLIERIAKNLIHLNETALKEILDETKTEESEQENIKREMKHEGQ